jgi:hypothetical protein
MDARWGWVVNAKPRPLYPRERDPVTTAYEAGWVPGPVLTGVENLAPREFRSPDRPARSKSLYRPPTSECNILYIPYFSSTHLSCVSTHVVHWMTCAYTRVRVHVLCSRLWPRWPLYSSRKGPDNDQHFVSNERTAMTCRKNPSFAWQNDVKLKKTIGFKSQRGL